MNTVISTHSLKIEGDDAIKFIESLISIDPMDNIFKTSFLLKPDGKVNHWFVIKRVNDKLEFKHEGILRNKFKNFDGKIIDEAVSSITKEDYFNDKISDRKDIESNTTVPLLGTIGSNVKETEIPVFESPKSSISESCISIQFQTLPLMLFSNSSRFAT